jgi:WD40 repeat protein
MALADAHPPAELLADFARGTISDAARDDIEGHVAVCPQCQLAATEVPADGVVELFRRAHAGHGRVSAETAPHLETPVADGPPGADAVPDALLRHDRYRIGRLLGQGGMGSVYEAEHLVMGRTVAIKVIRRALTARPAAVERFRREVRAAAALSHPNVVTTLDAEDAGGTHFLVMERVDGESLARVVAARGPLPLIEACEYARQAALGLHHAHAHGLVHRDVKPDNLMLVSGGVVKVLDFGLAALVTEDDAGLTGEQVLMGTPDYIAPEQAIDPRAADARADVYGLGCTLFFLLTGRVPYPADTAVAKVIAHRERPIPLARRLSPAVPPGLDRVLARLMAKRPEDRYSSCAEVATALEPFTKPPRPRPRRWPAILGALAAVLLVAAVYRIQTDKGELVITTESDDVEVVVKRGGKVVRIIDTKTNKSITLDSGVYELELEGGKGLKLSLDKATLSRGDKVIARVERVPPVPAPQPPIEPVRRFFHGTDRHVHDLAFSPDSRHVAAIDVGAGGRANVTLWDLATGQLVRKYTDIGWGRVLFTPDGKRLVVLLAKSVRVFDVATGALRDLPETKESTWDCELSPDGRHLTTTDSDFVRRLWDLDTGRQLRCWDGETDPHLFTPDGKQIVLSVRRDPDRPFRLWNIADGTEGAGNGMPFRGLMRTSMLKGGKEIVAVRDGALHVHDWATGKPLRKIELGSGFEGERGRDGTISPDGRLFLCPSTRGELRLWDLATGKPLDLPLTWVGPRMFVRVISPDNRWAALGHNNEIVVIRLPDVPPAPPVRP